MSLNFLQKSLNKLADTQASYKAFKGTSFNRYMDSIISTTGEVAKANLEITNAAYNAFLKSTGQPITQEIKDRKKYKNVRRREHSYRKAKDEPYYVPHARDDFNKIMKEIKRRKKLNLKVVN